ncbi:MAG: hypothetical protein Q9193_000957 [Seirophora villosa]
MASMSRDMRKDDFEDYDVLVASLNYGACRCNDAIIDVKVGGLPNQEVRIFGRGYLNLSNKDVAGVIRRTDPITRLRPGEGNNGSIRKSPNRKFGFHVPTFHGNLPTYTDWEASWTVVYTKILGRAIDIDQSKSDPGPAFTAVRKLLFDYVIPRLLDPLSGQGRSIKPCLVHGDLWDENCATDMASGEPFAFDAGSLYAHNEYEIGYWRPPRHRLSNKAYARSYKRFFPVSEPADEWDDRNLLYSMRYNVGLDVLIPSSGQREVEMDGLFNTSAPGSAVEQEELEYEDEEAKSNLDNTAAEMGLRTDDLVAGLYDNDGGDQAMPTERIHEDLSDLEHHLDQIKARKEKSHRPHTSGNQRLKSRRPQQQRPMQPFSPMLKDMSHQ